MRATACWSTWGLAGGGVTGALGLGVAGSKTEPEPWPGTEGFFVQLDEARTETETEEEEETRVVEEKREQVETRMGCLGGPRVDAEP
jgi:hypothetical protein